MKRTQVAGLSIDSNPDTAIPQLKFEWRSDATGHWITCSANVMDCHPYALAKTLQDFSFVIAQRHKDDIAEGKAKK